MKTKEVDTPQVTVSLERPRAEFGDAGALKYETFKTILGLFRLRVIRPEAPRPYRAFGYPLVPGIDLLGAAAILLTLFAFRPATTWPGLVIALCGLPVYALLVGKAAGKGIAL